MSEWHKYPEEKPKLEGNDRLWMHKKFLTSDQYGHITIKQYYKDEKGEEYFEQGFQKPAKNVFFWMELPESPVANNENLVKIESLKRKRKELSDQIKQLEQELKGCESK